MLDKDTAVLLARYSDWADQLLFVAVASLPEGLASRPGANLFGSMIGTLNHNHQVDLIWQAHLLGVDHGFTSRRDLLYPELGALREAQSRINAWYIDWAQRQTPQTLGERLAFRYVSGRPGEMARGGILLHVVNHKTYHRGWVAQMLQEVGSKPPETDLCVFLSR